MHVGIRSHPPALTPGQYFLNDQLNLRSLRTNFDDLPNRSNLESLADFNKDLPQRELENRLTGNVDASMDFLVLELSTIVLKPAAIRPAVSIKWGQILPGLPMDMEFYRYWSSTVLLHDTDRDTLGCRPNRRQRPMIWLVETSYRDRLSSLQTELGIGMGGVFNQEFVLRYFRKLIIVRAGPIVIRILGQQLGRDHLPQIQLHLTEQATIQESWFEPGPLGKL